MAAILNERQLEAVTLPDKIPALVLAGPGSGKTRVLTKRVEYLVSCLEIPPSAVLAVTFTNKAANEMRVRLQKQMGADRLKGTFIGTLHSLCARLLRETRPEVSGAPANFVVLSDSQAKAMLLDALKAAPQIRPHPNEWDLRAAIAVFQCTEQLAPDEVPNAGHPYSRFKAVYRRYTAAKRASAAVDFNDLLFYVSRMLKANVGGVRDYLQRRYLHVLVDECQDLSAQQLGIVTSLCGGAAVPFAVGDFDQSCYGWRSADPRVINSLREAFPLREISLEQNYRSSGQVLRLANAVISAAGASRANTSFALRADNRNGPKPSLLAMGDAHAEGRHVAAEVARLRGLFGWRYADFAVVFRLNAHSRAVEEALNLAGIPYHFAGGVAFYEREEVADIVSVAHLLAMPRMPSFQRAVRLVAGVRTGTAKSISSAVDAARAAGGNPAPVDLVRGLLDPNGPHAALVPVALRNAPRWPRKGLKLFASRLDGCDLA